MPAELITKLRRFADLRAEDVRIVEQAVARTRIVGPREHFVHEGDEPRLIHVLISGYTCRYKTSREGRRQITAILVPGDTCDLHGFLLRHLDHGVMTLTECTLGLIARETLVHLTEHHPRLARAFWWCNVVDDSIAREWLANLGHRSAKQRIAHLFCELAARLEAVGLASEWFEFPLTQEELGDAMGLSTVHVNRTLQELRGEGLITLRDRTLVINERARLEQVAGFDRGYLHLETQARSGEPPSSSGTEANPSALSAPPGRSPSGTASYGQTLTEMAALFNEIDEEGSDRFGAPRDAFPRADELSQRDS